MGNYLRKQPRLDDLPNEMLMRILSYLGKKNQMNVSLVNKRWYEASNYQIKDIRIRKPTNTENIQDLQNFINRFPNLRSLSLASPVGNYLELLPLKLLELEEKQAIEFDVRGTLIKESIRRIKVEDLEEFVCFKNVLPSQIIHFELDLTKNPEDLEREKEELFALNSLRRIALKFPCYLMIPRGFFEAILTRPALKQIDFDNFKISNWDFDIEQEFTKNPMVEEITFISDCVMNVPDLKKIKKLLDALPNIKRVQVVTYEPHDIENLLVFLKMISHFKKLESLRFAIKLPLKNLMCKKIQDLLNIVKDFPIKAKVIIADIHSSNDDLEYLKNVIVKEEAKPPKKVSQPRYPLSGSSFDK